MDLIKPKLQETEEFLGEVNPSISPTSVELNLLPLKGFFGLENPNHTERDQMDFIYKYYDKLGTENTTELLIKLHQLRSHLGMANFGQSTLSQAYNYLRVLSQMSELEQLKIVMEHGTPAK